LGQHIAVDRVRQEDGKPNVSRRAAVLDLDKPETSVMETPAEDWEFNPVKMMAGPGHFTTLHAAFSLDDQQLMTLRTKPSCTDVERISPALVPTQVPYCAQQTSTVQIWQVATGARTAEIFFDVNTGEAATQRQVLGLAISTEPGVTQTLLERS